MSELTREHLETFVFDPHRAGEGEVVAMARELANVRKAIDTFTRMTNRDSDLIAQICTAMGADPEDVGMWPDVVARAVAELKSARTDRGDRQ